MSGKLLVIADDLTGANDTGVQFAKQGLKTVVLMSAAVYSNEVDADVVVIDTNSRALPGEAAAEVVRSAAAIISSGGFTAVYKKIDSTLRGNIGAEIDAVFDSGCFAAAVMAPAFPKNGRTTIGGYQLLHNAPLEATEIARDPKFPVTESYLPALLAGQSRRKVGQLGIKEVLGGVDAIGDVLLRQVTGGSEIVVCDAWHDSHFPAIAAGALKLGKPVLWVGSAGLAECLPALLGMAEPKPALPVVVLAGSVSAVTRGQVAAFVKQPAVAMIKADPIAFLQAETTETELTRCYNLAAAAIAKGEDVVIATGYSEDLVEETKARGTAAGINSREVGNRIASALGELGKRIAATLNLSGMVFTGGDIAVSVCLALGATGIRVIEEVAPGIPVGTIQGVRKAGLPVVTKAGAFGAEDALVKAVACLKNRRDG